MVACLTLTGGKPREFRLIWPVVSETGPWQDQNNNAMRIKNGLFIGKNQVIIVHSLKEIVYPSGLVFWWCITIHGNQK
jgi:hypothetical protein